MMLLMSPLSLLAVYCCCLVRLSESVLWPAGSYGIPRAASGCPSADGFQWLVGRRYQDTEDNNPSNHKSQQFHLDATVDSKRGILRSFCMKTDTSTDIRRRSWPPGKYCIYKKGGSCPPNLTSGFIKWDDEDNNNLNDNTGTLPDGVYDHNTEIEFCCRTDGNKNDPITLPTLKPFFLLAYDSAECQQVKWATVNVEWIRFDNEEDDNADGKGGSYPHGAGINGHTIHYCYYQGLVLGSNVAAIIGPVLACIFAAALLLVGLFYWRRRRAKKDDMNTVLYQRLASESSVHVKENDNDRNASALNSIAV